MFDNYKYYVNKEHGIVVAVTTYAGKPVRGIAKCDPRDTFDEETGKRLAAARCAVKVARKRCDRAVKEFAKAHTEYHKVVKKYDDMSDYVNSATVEYEEALNNLHSISAEL